MMGVRGVRRGVPVVALVLVALASSLGLRRTFSEPTSSGTPPAPERSDDAAVPSDRLGAVNAPTRPDGSSQSAAGQESTRSDSDEELSTTTRRSGTDPLHDDEVEPHPLGPERMANAEQHALFGSVTEAIERGDYGRARQLLSEHSARFGDAEGWREQRAGFERALDCLEEPGPETRARGAEYVAAERLSPLRRRVRRTCLEERPFSGRG